MIHRAFAAPQPSDSVPAWGAGSSVGASRSLADALLPSGVVAHEAVDVAARVVLPPAGSNGDWFDSAPLSERRIGLMVGDVAGRGLAALATMAQLRAALRLALQRHGEPARAIQEVDRYALMMPGAPWARAAVAVVDPLRSTACYATAGNPPPVVVRDGEGCRRLRSTDGGPIGAGTSGERTSTTVPLRRDDVLLLYTDGLLGPAPQSTIRNLEEAVLDPGKGLGSVDPARRTTADLVCHHAVAALREVPNDDVVVLAAGMDAAGPPSTAVTLPVRAESARAARRALLEWTGPLGLAEVDEIALAQALAEVVGNVVEHARASGQPVDGSTTFAVRATLTGAGEVEVTVTDRGRWTRPSAASGAETRTGGLDVAARFVDDVLLDSGPEGTSVVLHHHVERPVTLLSARSPTSRWRPPDPSLDDGFATRLDDGVLELAGPLDHDAAREVGEVVRMASLGVERLVVDLDRVSVLSTAAVRAIETRRVRAAHAPEIRLVAGPDTTAGRVLTMMGIEHQASR